MPTLRRSAREPHPNPRFQPETHAAIKELPTTFDEAVARPDGAKWEGAIVKEIGGYNDRDALEGCDCPPEGSTVLTPKVRFVEKPKPDGETKYKVRITIRGCGQRPGRDYGATYSPTVMVQSIFICLFLAAHFAWITIYIDIANAYMEAPPDRKIYLKLTDELIKYGLSNHRYVELKTNTYGTKQGGLLWFRFWTADLIELEYEQLINDVCVFVKFSPDRSLKVIVFVYVDDFGITGSWTEEIERLCAHMRSKYRKIKEQKEITYFRGMRLQWDRPNRVVWVDQTAYTDSVVADILKTPHTDAGTPLASTKDYHEECEPAADSIQTEVGKLRFLADLTRPDLLHAVNLLSSHAASPGTIHLKGVTHIARHLQKTREYALKLGGIYPIAHRMYSDAGFNARRDGRPTLCIAEYLSPDSGAFHVKSRTSTTICMSVTEAETKAAAEAVKAAIWTRDFLLELGEEQRKPSQLFVDNSAVLDIVQSPGNYQNCRTYNRDIAYIRQAVTKGVITPDYVPSQLNTADLGTKLLAEVPHTEHAQNMLCGYQVPEL